MKKIFFIVIIFLSIMLIALSCRVWGKADAEIQETLSDDIVHTETDEQEFSAILEVKPVEAAESEEEFALIYNPPEGGSPENEGKILFSSKYNDEEESTHDFLYLMDPDGTNLVRLAYFGHSMAGPSWSPEYSRIAYSARLTNQSKIFIMTADGSANKQLTFGEGDDKFPTWAPDGTHIAYISYIDKVPNLFIIDIYGENKKQLTFAEGGDAVLWPSFSPVCDTIAYTYNQEGGEVGARILTIKSDGTEMLEFMEPSVSREHFAHPGWSPDGKTIYFISGDKSSHTEIWKVDYYKVIHNLSAPEEDRYDDIGLMKLTNLVSIGAAATFRPRVSPNGEQIVFCGGIPTEKPSGYNLITVNIDGSNPINITSAISEACNWPDW